MNYGQLKTAVQAYLGNRTDITTTLLDQAADQVRERISTDLRADGVAKTVTVPVTNGVGTIPSDFERAMHVANADGNTVQPGNKDAAARYNGATGSAAMYWIDDAFRSYPASTENLTLTYFAGFVAADIDSDSDTITYPEMWLAGMVSQLALYIQNADLSMLWEQRYQRAVRQHNDAFQMRQRAIGRSNYDYSARTPGL